MFPLNWNIPFIRKNGSRTTLGAITGDIAGIEEDVAGLTTQASALWETMGQNGAKNLLPNNGTTQTINGVTFTVNADKTITANGTATANTDFGFYFCGGKEAFVGKEVILSGCPEGGASNTYNLSAYRASTVDGSGGTQQDFGDGKKFIYANNGSGTASRVYIFIQSGQTLSNLVFKPMIRLASDLDSTYQPYTMTNRDLTDKITSFTNGLRGEPASASDYDFNFIPPTIPYIQYIGNAGQWAHPIEDAGTQGGSVMWMGRLDTAARITQLFFCNNGAIYQRLVSSDDLESFSYGNWIKNTV